jgi:hypothetical protein
VRDIFILVAHAVIDRTRTRAKATNR